MKKNEIKILIALAVVAILAVVGIRVYNNVQASKQPKTTVDILLDSEVVQTFDPSVNATYRIQGNYGQIDIEVKDGKWHVTNEECPNHICSSMGWSSTDDSFPIICIPNGVIVMVENPQS